MQSLSHVCAVLLVALAISVVFAVYKTARVLGHLAWSDATAEARLYAYVRGGAL